MPFNFQAYRSPLTDSIADRIARGGDIRARAAVEAGNATANAVRGVGDVLAGVPAQMANANRQQTVDQMNNIKLQEMQRGVADSAAMDRAFSPSAALGPGGQGPMPEGAAQPTRDQILSSLPGHLQERALKQFAEIDQHAAAAREAKQKAQAADNDYFGALAHSVKQWLPDGAESTLAAAKMALDHAKEQGYEGTDQLLARIQGDPQHLSQILDSVIAQSPKYAETLKGKTREVTTQNPDGSSTVQIVDDKPGQSFTSSPRPKEPKTREIVTMENGRRVTKIVPDEAGASYPLPPTDTASEPLVPIMGPDGQSVLVPRSQAVGKRPANSREQGRAVTAGDASDLADFDTSRDELAAVRAALSGKDSTGIIARVGATLPYVTQITGWGADAKKRQAVIDRVKQVIGKTLEGGVLRKEDEAKYEKILPTIGDEASVANEKLKGLEDAIAKRKVRRLDALSDAGYDVTKFNARTAAAPSAAPPPAGAVPSEVVAVLKGQQPGQHTLSDGSVWILQRDGSIVRGSR